MGGFGFDSSRGISFFANSSQAANTLAMERVRITPGGNVGIGTTDPQATLQVSGSLIVSTSAQTTTPSLYVGTNGNVGVGTAIPQAKLDVVGGRVRIQDTSASLAFVSSGASRVGLVYQNVDNLNLAADTVGVMASFSLLAPDGSFKLSSAGNVGIGTTAPAKTLDVSGTARITSNTEVSGTIKLSGIDGEACTPDKYGTMRFNPVTKALQICRK